MKDEDKTREHLNELTELRSQNIALKKSITGTISAELAAEEARRYAESIVETVREPLLVLDADLKIISANRNFYSTFKVIPGETLGCFIYDLGNKQWDIPRLRELLEEVLPEKEAFDDFEVDHNFRDIGHKIMLLNARQIYRKDIGAKMILLAIEDITEHKRLESLLIDSEEQYRRLFETASDGIVLLEKREGKITHANPATEKLLGYTQKESIGNKLQDIGVVLDISDFLTTMQNLNKSGILNYRNVKVETKSGQHIDTEVYLVDRAKLVQCNIRDITDRKRAEQVIRDSNARLQIILDNSSTVVFLKDLEGRYITVNRRYEELFHVTRQTVVGKSDYDIFPREYADRFRQHDLLAMEKGGPFEVEELVPQDDSLHTYISAKFPLIGDDGKPYAVCGIATDITERKRAEEALRESEERYRELYDFLPIPVYSMDLEANITSANHAIYETFRGTERDLKTGFNAMQLLPPESIDKLSKNIQRLLQGEKIEGTEYTLMRLDGSVFPAIAISSVIYSYGKPVGIRGAIVDITERKLAEEKLQQALESLSKALSTTIQVMVSAVEARDPYTAGHQIRSAALARAIATEMRLPKEKIDGIGMAGSIHDIGKLSIPAEILTKATKLTDIEFSLIKEHSRLGYEMLKHVESPWPLAEMVYQHHERMDSSGYPRNLKGKEICLAARILAVADVVEAMASHRPYRPSLGIDAALEEIEKNSGTLYDKTVADSCIKLFREKGFKLTEA